ncbi:putative Pancreatic triacylglycerol lipase [Hypsibius exemplaris]|uniref:Pancreatic triacylglycerol lipase n=1 Tax=Hypsibius exemplaris TaxID=2072580 RepID=A0A9X6RJK3_HYPEX|nr:putative Pancreatic triacylglycerol lipase [Hypsibius exemplaris]
MLRGFGMLRFGRRILPSSLQKLLKLHLNTRNNPKHSETQILNPYEAFTIFNSHFKPAMKTQIIIHGFLDAYWWPWWTLLETSTLHASNRQLPSNQSVRTSPSSPTTSAPYMESVRQTFTSSVTVSRLSLGAQAGGYAGTITQQRYNFTIGRITGLDPAGPYFTWLPTSIRLDPSDAAVVFTIIIDGETIFNLAFGSPQPMDHLNFYPNGGLNQPGCENGVLAAIFGGPTMNSTTFDALGTLAATALEAVACNHARAPVLFHESINNPACTMKSFQCDNYQAFLRGECFTCRGQRCAALGYHANLALASPYVTKNFYTITTARSPFCSK